MTLSVWDVYRAALRERAQVYHLHDSELLTIVPFLRLTGAAVVYDVHEDLPQTIDSRHWIPKPLRRVIAPLVGLVEWAFSRAASGVVAATPAIARRFPPGRTVIVQNFSMIDELKVANPTPYAAREPIFVYIGAIADVRGARELVLGIGEVPPSFGARLILAGPISEDDLLEELKQRPGWKRVEYHARQTREQVARHLDRARAGIVTFHPTGNYIEAYPVKMFEYMAAGIPLIVSSFPLWHSLLDDVGCAIFVDPLDPSALAEAMQWILSNPEEAERMGARGRLAAQQRFNWQAEATKLLRFYDELLDGPNLRTEVPLTDA
jgi:glycosyltransferase involved in cell wall biosynthesis